MTTTETQHAPEPGLYENIPFYEYLLWPYPSQSTIKHGRTSMAHMKAAMDTSVEPTDSMRLGTALHCAFLEPEQLMDRVAVWRDGRRSGKEWKAFTAYNHPKTIITENQYEKLKGMLKSLRAHKIVREWINRIEAVEVSCVGDIHGVRCKGQCDAKTADPLIDLKMSNNADLGIFAKNAFKLGYEIQVSVYRKLYDRERFILMVVEDSPPFDVVPFEFTDAALRVADAEVKDILTRWKSCCEKQHWPGRSDGIIEIDLPAWKVEQEHKDEVKIS